MERMRRTIQTATKVQQHVMKVSKHSLITFLDQELVWKHSVDDEETIQDIEEGLQLAGGLSTF